SARLAAERLLVEGGGGAAAAAKIDVEVARVVELRDRLRRRLLAEEAHPAGAALEQRKPLVTVGIGHRQGAEVPAAAGEAVIHGDDGDGDLIPHAHAVTGSVAEIPRCPSAPRDDRPISMAAPPSTRSPS